MPCFKGIAVSIHANGNPLAEYGIQRQSRVSRISTYIPVPQPTLNNTTNKPEPAKFAISITLLTPGLPVPYSTPQPTHQNPNPKPQLTGPLPATPSSHNGPNGLVAPYIPMTNSENETIAAYIYFDGRAKEEVATLLRPGEETWVNSRWVQVSPLEGGGLAEREFLFREVGLEKWLNGLDLLGHDVNVSEKLERRRQKFERRRRRQLTSEHMDAAAIGYSCRDALRYGADARTPLETIDQFDSDSPSDDDEPPEATGQIKIAMFRVLASGEIKKGEYSPQFDACDDDDTEGNSGVVQTETEVEHTTSFAKPKTLDPKTISTQTVTGIDGPDKPFATFTFFYRGERQLQKIGVLAQSFTTKHDRSTPSSMKRRSGQLDFSHLGPLKSTGTVGFSTFRDEHDEQARRRKARKKGTGALGVSPNDDSDEEDSESELLGRMHDVDDRQVSSQALGSEDAKSQGELADGLGRIRLKRAHSIDSGTTPQKAKIRGIEASPGLPQEDMTPRHLESPGAFSKAALGDTIVGSPSKKQKPFPGGEGRDSEILSITGSSITPRADSRLSASTQTLSKPDLTLDDEL